MRHSRRVLLAPLILIAAFLAVRTLAVQPARGPLVGEIAQAVAHW